MSTLFAVAMQSTKKICKIVVRELITEIDKVEFVIEILRV